MKNSSKLLQNAGFTKYPITTNDVFMSDVIVANWFNNLDIAAALEDYDLLDKKYFMDLFNPFLELISENVDLQATAYILYQILFEQDVFKKVVLRRDEIDMLPVFVLLSGHKKHIQNMTARGFDGEQINLHKKSVGDQCLLGIKKYKIKGATISRLLWARNYINACVIQIGNLQYKLGKDEPEYRNIGINSNYTVSIHIPYGGRFDDASVGESLCKAKVAIKKYFSEVDDDTPFVCDSWLLDEDLGKYLSPDGNISKFRNRFQFIKSNDDSKILKHVFNNLPKDVDFHLLPEDTSLRREIKRALIKGVKFYDGIGLLKPDNLTCI